MNATETAKDAVRRLFAKELAEGFKPIAGHPYRDADGTVLFLRPRLKHSDGRKHIRPIHLNGEGRYVLGEPAFPGKKPLYRLDELAKNTGAEAWVTEGEQKADALAKLGLLATTSGGADSAERADWQALAGRAVRIWPDFDAAGQRYADNVAAILTGLGCKVSLVDVAKLALPEKGDAVDWLAAHPGVTAADVSALPTAEVAAELVLEHPDDEKGERQSQASAIVGFVHEHAELFHDENRDVFATDKATGETRRLDSRQFRDWISAGFYGATGKAARDQSIREAISTLAGLGRFQGECRPVFVRVAQHADSYYLDLGEHGKGRAVRIDPGKWEIVDSPPVRFLRPETLRPLPEPERGGDVATLWTVANVPESARLLVLAWLCECLRPDTPFPVLELLGEHGSAKSTTQIALRRLIDPNASDLRAAPKNVEDIFVGAGSSWIVSYENISHLSAPAQDALCVLATGGGFATRKFYTNTEESVIVVKRPIVLNGIAAAVTAQDLVDRTVSVETPLIEDRKETAELWRLFDREHGRLLGALLDVVAAALGRLPGTHLSLAFRPRMIEFARLGMAVAEAVGKAGENFMTEFNASRAEIIARTIDASPAASALLEWFEARSKREVVLPVKDLMEEVEKFRPANTDAWPKSPKGFGDALRRAAPALRTMGTECRCLGKTGGSVRWKISAKVPVEPSPASPECPNAETQSRTCRTFRTSSDPEARDDRSARYV